MRTHRTLALSVLLLAASACTPGAMAPPPHLTRPDGDGVVGEWVVSGGYRRSYVLATPEVLDEEAKHPVLVVMHGTGIDGEAMRQWSRLDSLGTAVGYVVVFPDGIQASWDLGCFDCTPPGALGVNDLRFVETLIRQLAGAFPVDTSRVFVVGHSVGGQFAHHYACQATIPASGIASVGGSFMRNTSRRCPEKQGLGILMIHGDRDPVLPWRGPLHTIGALSLPEAVVRWSYLQGCTAVPQYAELPDSAGDGTRVGTTDIPCPEGGHVRLLRIRGGGHGWPGYAHPIQGLGPVTANLDASLAILDFFEPWARRAESTMTTTPRR